MLESAQYSPLSIVVAQIVVLVLNAILYSRQKNSADNEKRERGRFGETVTEALHVARDAKKTADNVDGEKYRALASIVEQQGLEIARLRATVLAQEETIKSLANKLASRERADRAAERRAEASATPAPGRDEDQAATSPGGLDAATLARLGAIPFQPEAAPAAASRPNNFGRRVA